MPHLCLKALPMRALAFYRIPATGSHIPPTFAASGIEFLDAERGIRIPVIHQPVLAKGVSTILDRKT
jgi:hypothetical protein